jgi:S-methylmethionine-dependent homocysteine/selenocysteine methylase
LAAHSNRVVLGAGADDSGIAIHQTTPMSKYRHRLRRLLAQPFVTDAGLETWLIFQRGVELRHFAAFELLRSAQGAEMLREWYRRFGAIATDSGCGLLLESPTWRASADWGARLGLDRDTLADLNHSAIGLLLELRAEIERPGLPVLVCGNMGPRGDGYVPGERMSVAESEAYHREQIRTFAGTDADLVSVFTMNYVDEAIGVARAARAEAMPVVVSFTCETDGRLPSGESLPDAIVRTDEATDGHVLHYMINCAHPAHFDTELARGGAWLERVRGVRANASCLSHAELEASTELDDGDPDDLAGRYLGLRRVLPRLSVIGGCCGTDDRHVAAMAHRLFGEVSTC